MADEPRILIAGGSGVFGRLLVRELLQTTSARLVLAGRDPRRVAEACHELAAPDRLQSIALDLTRPGALEHAARGFFAVACAAGPFQSLPPSLPSDAVAAGVHWLDIADDPGWVLPLMVVREGRVTAVDAGLAIIPGLSTTPALSGVLVRWCLQRLPHANVARITLYIGNRNAKGSAAITSVLTAGLADPRPVDLPTGRHEAYRFPSPDASLLREELGLRAEFRVAFEWRIAGRLLSALSPVARRLGSRGLDQLARLLSAAAAPSGHFGSDLGCLQAEVEDESGHRVRCAVVAAGQRLAILPCAIALNALLNGELTQRGVIHAALCLSPDEWIRRLELRGVQFIEAA
jgi:hypothetical protein